jgi:hypothetical protein
MRTALESPTNPIVENAVPANEVWSPETTSE